MPRGNRTGPFGMGPRTGRAMGYCSGYDAPGFMNPGPGMGFGAGRGMRRGMGMGRGFWRFGAAYPPVYGAFAAPQMSEKDEMSILEEEAAFLSRRQQQISERMDELKTKG